MNLADYETLVAQLAVEIRRYLVSRGADPETAADIVQDMFVKVLESDLVLPPEKLRPYLYRVAWSTYLDAYRRRQRYRQLVDRYLGPALQRPPAPGTLETLAHHDWDCCGGQLWPSGRWVSALTTPGGQVIGPRHGLFAGYGGDPGAEPTVE